MTFALSPNAKHPKFPKAIRERFSTGYSFQLNFLHDSFFFFYFSTLKKKGESPKKPEKKKENLLRTS